jgi:hypothetical protein
MELEDNVDLADRVQVEARLTISGDWRSDPLKLLHGLEQGARSIGRWERAAVAEARDQNMTWDEIGKACGISRQAAWERFSTEPEGDLSDE